MEYVVTFMFGVATGFVSARLTDYFRSRDQRHEGTSKLVASASTLFPRLRERIRLYDTACANDGDPGTEAYFRSVDLIASGFELQELQRALSGATGLSVLCRDKWLQVCSDLESAQNRHEELRAGLRLSRRIENTKTTAYRQRLEATSGVFVDALRATMQPSSRTTRAEIDRLLR